MTDKPDLASGIAATGLAEDKPVMGMVGDQKVVLVRHAGRLCALAGQCTHLGAPLDKGLVVDGELRCPWHHARFSLTTGEAVGAPAFEPLTVFDVVEDGGSVRVTGERQAAMSNRDSAGGGTRIVIIGGGAAGHACADMLARGGQGARVTILSDDPDPPYDRTFCSKQYLSGKKQRDDCRLPAAGLGRGAEPTTRTGVEVREIDLAAREVVTADDARIGFDTLVLATGAGPVLAEFAGNDHANVHRLRTLGDADALIAAAENAKGAVIVGASFIALEVAASLISRDLSVTVVAPDEVPLGDRLGRDVGDFVQNLHAGKGVRFALGRTVQSYDGAAVTLDDGSTLRADLVVIGTGVAPRTDLAEKAGLTLATKDEGGGVKVDDRLRTSTRDVYAIGDLASYPDPHSGKSIRVEHWVHAQRQGQYLARSLMGEITTPFGDTPFFWSGHYGTSLRYVGHVPSPDDRQIDGSVEAGEFAVRYLDQGEPKAVLTCKRDLESLDKEAAWDI